MGSTSPAILALRSANGLSELGEIAQSFGLRRALAQPLRRVWERGLISEHAAVTLRGSVPAAEAVTVGDFLGNRDWQRELKRRTTSEVRRDVLRAMRTLLESPELEAADGHPRTRAEILAWAQQAGVAHLLDAPLEVLHPILGAAAVERTHHPIHQRLSILDVLAPPGVVRRPETSLKKLEPAAWKWLEAEAAAVQKAIAGEPAFLAAPPPAHPVIADLHALLLRARVDLRAAALPSPVAALEAAQVMLEPDPPRLVVRDARVAVTGWSTSAPRVTTVLDRWREGVLESRCSFCTRESCVHTLLAVDAALLWLRRLSDADQEKVAQILATPTWMRTLAHLKEAVGTADETGAPARELGGGAGNARVAWRIDPKRSEIRVKILLRRPTRKGGWTTGTLASPEEIAQDDRRAFLPQDRRAAAFLSAGRYSFGPDHLWHALASLEGHPDVAFASAPEQPIRIAEVELGLVCVEEPDGALSLKPSVEGKAVDLETLVSLKGGGRRYIFCDEERRACFLVRARAEVAKALEVLAKKGNTFPAEAAEELGRQLWDFRIPIALPPRLLGAEVDADPSTLVVARLEGLTLTLEAQVRPLPAGLTFPVAEGPLQVRGAQDGRRVFAVRRFESERQRAEAVFSSLGLPSPEPGQPFRASAEGAEAIAWLRRLEAAARDGLEVLWPPRRPTITRAIQTKDLRVTVRPARDWFGVSGAAEVDEARIQLALLLEAARKKQRFIRLSEDAWAELSDELIQSLGPLAELTVEADSGAEVSVAAAPVLETLSSQVAEFDGAPKLSELLERMKAASSRIPELPSGLGARLRPYQREGFEWMSRLAGWAPGACLADDMGLGKTLQALALLLERSARGPQLVVAPTSVCFNWENEAARFAPGLRVHAWRTSDREALCSSLGPGDVVVVSYGLLTRDLEKLKTVSFATAVFDEAQAVKNASALRSRAAREVRAEFRLALTGTPLENHLGELWSLMRVIFPGLLGSEAQFRERFQLPIERSRDPERKKALAAVVRPFLLRRTKAQVATELPARTEVVVPVTLSSAERALYDDARLAAVAELEGGAGGGAPEQRRFQVLAALTRLRLLACHPKLHDPSWTGPASKLERLMELVRELRAEGHRALVFSQFTRHLAVVREALEREGVRLQYLDGETPERERRRRVEAFQEGSGDVFLISLKAGGTGLNLTGADYVIHLDPWWNPAVEDQATDRAHRIGQTKPVTVFRLVAQGTVEEQILALHGDKRSLLAGVLEGTSEPTRFDVDELLALLRYAGGASPAEEEVDGSATESDAPASDSRTEAGSAGAPVGVQTVPATSAEGFRAWLRAEHEQGRIGKGPVTSYPRSVERFLDFAAARGLPVEPGPSLENSLSEYLRALDRGEVDAPASEVTLARTAVRKFGVYLEAGSRAAAPLHSAGHVRTDQQTGALPRLHSSLRSGRSMNR